MSGDLYIVATPIGNLDDITLRALDVLKNADIIFAESVERTKTLLTHYDIKKKVLSYNKERLRLLNHILKNLKSSL
jgi:16S rRNA (cytidine1402-2'-O)-methyltransferase